MRATARRHIAIPFSIVLLLQGCAEEGPDAYGNFEAREVVVSAEVAGELVSFAPAEGERLAAGAGVGQIDTVTLSLQRRELASQQGAARMRAVQAEAQIGVLRAQLETAREEYARTRRLFAAEAATAQQLNRAVGEVRALEEQVAAARAVSAASLQETGGADARIEQVAERIRSGRIVNPVAGTVLATYAEAGEFVQPGQPLYKVADLDTLTLRAYVSGAQLAGLHLGGPARVRLDGAEGELLTLPGRVSWISSEAEFTPTPIQTREERTGQVYAVKIRVPNRGGVVKIGMPGEVVFPAPGERREAVTAATGAGERPRP